MDRQMLQYSFFTSRTPTTQATRRAIATRRFPSTGRSTVLMNIQKGALS